MQRNSTVSAVIPTRNRPHLVTRAVRSALAQTYGDMDVIVVVDGPDDATEQALAGITDQRLRVIVLPEPQGAAGARNLGVQAAWGDWIALLDDDDEWLPEKTAIQMRAAQGSQFQFPIVSSQLIARTSSYELNWPRTQPFAPVSEYLLSRRSWSYGDGLLATITLLLPKDLYALVPFQAGLPRHQDLDWAIRATAQAGAGLEFVPQPLAVWHQAEGRQSINVKADWRTSFRWLESVRGMITRRAYAGFVATHIAPQAARQGAWREIPFLLNMMFTYGAPGVRDFLLFVGMWTVPQRIRNCVRREGK